MSEITWTPTTIKLGALVPWERNPKRMSKRAAERLLANWRDLGQWQTLAVGPGGEVYDGHQRLSALLRVYGREYEVQVLQASRALLDDERARLVIEGSASAVGNFDWDALAGWDAGTLHDFGFDGDLLAAWNDDAANLRELLEAEQPAQVEDVEPQIDKAEELRVKWGVEPGQLWQLGDHRLICGDCTDAAVVARLGKIDYLFTDPPYGIDVDTSWLTALNVKRGKPANLSDDKLAGDDGTLDLSWLWQYDRRMVWGFPYIFDPQATGWIVWDKQPGVEDRGVVTPIEMASTTMRKGFDMVRVMWGGYYRAAGEDRHPHPTQKPVGVVAPFIEAFTKPNEIILDPFLGSGTTLIACERLGRRCRAVEIEPKYVAVALERWATMTGQTPVLLDGSNTAGNSDGDGVS